MFLILAFSIGLLTRSEIKASLITFIIGVFYCLLLYILNVSREMSGVFETIAFAGLSAAICSLRKQFFGKNRK